MSKRMITVAALSALAISIVVGPGVAQAASQYEGEVVSKNADKRTFTLRQDEGGGTFIFKVTSSTKFQRIAGFSAITVGATGIEVNAVKRNGRLIATQVERSGKFGGGGGGDDGPNDDD